jgi:large subunit ribosomal protein L21
LGPAPGPTGTAGMMRNATSVARGAPMYAILQQGGHQYRVAPGDRLLVDRLGAEVGSVISLEPVLLVEADGATTIGTPVVEGARVAVRVVAHPQGAKLRVFTYKPKKRHRRTHGHRSQLTELRVEALLSAGESLPAATPAPEKRPRPRRASRAAVAEESAPPAEESAPRAELTPAKTPRARRSTSTAPTEETPGEQLSSATPKPSRRAARPASTASPEGEAEE